MKEWAVALVAISLTGYLASALRSSEDILNPPVESKTLEAGEDGAGASLIGQFRTSAAASLYQRADLYLHGGVELRPISKPEQSAEVTNAHVKEGEAQTAAGDESQMVTSIPGPDRDFRGILGEWERATGAYKSMAGHEHKDPGVTFPLFRLMTWVDPHFIVGWTTGSMMLTKDRTPEAVRRMIDFLKQGLIENPDSIDILTRIGVLHAQSLGEVDESLVYFNRALQVVHDRKVGPEDRDAVREMYRWLAIVFDHQGDSSNLKGIVVEGLQTYSDDQVLLRFALKLGLPVTVPED